jgi:hypothetical protein
MKTFDDKDLDKLREVLSEPRSIRELMELCDIKYPSTAKRRMVALCQRDGLRLTIESRREGRAGPQSCTYLVED